MTDDMTDPDGGSGGAQTCFVLCPTADPVDLSRFITAVAKVFGEGPNVDQDGNETPVSVTFEDGSGGVFAHIPMPIPAEEVAESARNNMLWPDGVAASAAHQSHCIIAAMPAPGAADEDTALLLSRLALVALDAHDGIGVYWAPSGVSNSRAFFEYACEKATADRLPVEVWLRYQFASGDDDETCFFTQGMDQFGLMDIEVDRFAMEPVDLYLFAANIARYLVRNGPVISDGDTVGEDAGHRILVEHRPSMLEGRGMVYNIRFGQ